MELGGVEEMKEVILGQKTKGLLTEQERTARISKSPLNSVMEFELRSRKENPSDATD